ncbi:MAG: hypothetical protein WDW38_004811 [Sanguina aurantia]
MLQHAVLAFSVAAILAPFSYYAGLGAKQLRLPQITGYLISGIICGPYVLGILSRESVTDLSIIEGACLSIIGLAAGAELHLPELSRAKKQVMGITLSICLFTWAICYAVFEWLGGLFPLTASMDARHLVAAASLGSTLMMARSPASAIAVLKEMEGKGPFSSLVMAVVVVKDVVVIIAYALNVELIRVVGLGERVPWQSSRVPTRGLKVFNIMLPILSVALSATVGVCGGLLLSIVMRPHSILVPSLPGMSPTAQLRSRMLAVLVVSTFIFQLAHYFEAEPLLACVTMGMVVINRRHERAEKEREELHVMLAHIMSLTNVAFFALAGASLKLNAMQDMLMAALVVVVVRLAAIYMGSWVGCLMTSTTSEYRKVFWLSMVTQAGVAMGLARLAGTRFPDWGPDFQTFMMAIILLNLLLGPSLFRAALIRVGEAKGQGLTLPTLKDQAVATPLSGEEDDPGMPNNRTE